MTDSNQSQGTQVDDEKSAYRSNAKPDEPKSAPSWRARYRSVLIGWLGRTRAAEVRGTKDMSWTCPACRAPRETIIDSNAESGRIVAVSCPSCRANYRASVFFRAPRSGMGRVTVGVVWL